MTKLDKQNYNTIKLDKPSKFLTKFKDRLHKTGREGIATVLNEGNIAIDKTFDDKPSVKQNLNAWSNVYSECNFS